MPRPSLISLRYAFLELDLAAPAHAATDTGLSQRQTGGRTDGRSLPNDGAVDIQLRVMEAVIRRTLFDNPDGVARVMTVARAQLDAHLAAGRTIRSLLVRDSGPSIQRGTEHASGPTRVVPVRQRRDHEPSERNRSL